MRSPRMGASGRLVDPERPLEWRTLIVASRRSGRRRNADGRDTTSRPSDASPSPPADDSADIVTRPLASASAFAAAPESAAPQTPTAPTPAPRAEAASRETSLGWTVSIRSGTATDVRHGPVRVILFTDALSTPPIAAALA